MQDEVGDSLAATHLDEGMTGAIMIETCILGIGEGGPALHIEGGQMSTPPYTGGHRGVVLVCKSQCLPERREKGRQKVGERVDVAMVDSHW